MRYYIIAGEASGDLHASNLIRELRKLDNDAVIRGWGGDRMKKAGAELVMHYRHMSFMGFAEVLLNLRTIFAHLRQCKDDILNFKPDVVVLVDYPGFNFRIARFAKKLNIKVFYYVSPQVWAWKRSRVFLVKKWVDRMFVILPFEKPFYKRFGIDVDFVGHPLLDAIDQHKKNQTTDPFFSESEKPVVALLPGSRKQEISNMLGYMLEMIAEFPGYRFIVAATSALPTSFYYKIIGNRDVEVVFDRTYELLNASKAALVASGTATLETAMFYVPQVVCYKGNWLSVQIAKQLVKVKFISLVNLLMDRLVVKELIQGELNRNRLRKELDLILHNESAQQTMINNYKDLETKLFGVGASQRAAGLMSQYLRKP